jgi:hypothetical protein
MKNFVKYAASLVVALMLVLNLTGCIGGEAAVIFGGTAAAAGGGYAIYKAVNPVIEIVLQAAGYEAAVLGLQKLPPATATTVANDTIVACQDMVKYLNTGTLPTADIVNQVISARFSTLPPAVVSEIQAAAAKMGQYVPAASVVLTPEEIGDIVAFLTGIQSGATAFIGDNNITVDVKYTARKTVLKAKLKLKATPGALPWFYAAPPAAAK